MLWRRILGSTLKSFRVLEKLLPKSIWKESFKGDNFCLESFCIRMIEEEAFEDPCFRILWEMIFNGSKKDLIGKNHGSNGKFLRGNDIAIL